MTLSKIAFAVVALGVSFGPALAESADTNPRVIASIAASITEGRQAATLVSGPTDAERYITDRNLVGNHSR